jgi:hypothetical protein
MKGVGELQQRIGGLQMENSSLAGRLQVSEQTLRDTSAKLQSKMAEAQEIGAEREAVSERLRKASEAVASHEQAARKADADKKDLSARVDSLTQFKNDAEHRIATLTRVCARPPARPLTTPLTANTAHRIVRCVIAAGAGACDSCWTSPNPSRWVPMSG